MCWHYLHHKRNQDVSQLHDIADQVQAQVLPHMQSLQPSKIRVGLHGHVPTSHVKLLKQVQPLIGELVLLQQEVDLLFIITQCGRGGRTVGTPCFGLQTPSSEFQPVRRVSQGGTVSYL